MKPVKNKTPWMVLIAVLVIALLSGCDTTVPDKTIDPDNPQKDQTSFTTELLNGNSYGNGGGDDKAAPQAGGDAGTTSNERSDGAANKAPSGRTGTVEEADLYRVSGSLMFYLNTYKGLTVFDLKDAKKPKKIANIPVFGYPIEMFVSKNIVYALVRDSLYLTRSKGKFEFQRRYVSQLVTVDISNPKKPLVLQRLDIKGQLREGVSRKIDNTIYVVSYQPRWYWWGWSYSRRQQPQEQATVYSFNVENPYKVRMVQSLELLKNLAGTNKRTSDETISESFSGVTISATSNTLLVGEQWSYYRYKYNRNSSTGYRSCSEYENYNYTWLNVVDISDPKGAIKVHTRFKVRGRLTDQFKQTYIYNKTKNQGVYYGIYARTEWSRSGCNRGQRLVKNTLLTVDISNGKSPKVLDELAFGKPNETVRGSLFDQKRGVVYAITAIQRDPFYVISIANPAKLKVLSEIDGLSGDINLFRFIGDRKFLLAVGRDNSKACTGFDSDNGWRSTNLAVSIIDVQNTGKARLVQRKCIALKNARWTSSAINWNLDQAHKMIGMYSAKDLNLLTVPVNYSTVNERGWYEYKSAIGILRWDLSKYDPKKDEKSQDVLNNISTVVHPKGSVKRTIIAQLPQASGSKRVVINLSDTHISLVDLDDIKAPSLLSTFELAPYIGTVYRFGNYLVEQLSLGRYYDNYNEFRVKRIAQGDINDAAVLASFKVGQVSRVVRWKNKLLLFRRVIDQANTKKYGRIRYDYRKSQLVVLDLANPLKPALRGTLTLPFSYYPYYYFYCGMFDMGYRFSYGYGNTWLLTSTGLANLWSTYDYKTRKSERSLFFIDVSDADNPKLVKKTLSTTNGWNYYNLVRQDDDNFFVTTSKPAGSRKRNNTTFYLYRYYAQRWSVDNKGNWNAGVQINIPGWLTKAYKTGGKTMLLTRDYSYFRYTNPGSKYTSYTTLTRLYLLELVKNDKLAALRDYRVFKDWSMYNMLIKNERLYMVKRRNWYYLNGLYYNKGASRYGQTPDWKDKSDHLDIFDLSAGSFKLLASHTPRTYNLTLVGIHNQRLFLRLQGDGILVVDARNPKTLQGLHFERTLGWAQNIELAGDNAFIAAGYFGIYSINLNKASIPH